MAGAALQIQDIQHLHGDGGIISLGVPVVFTPCWNDAKEACLILYEPQEGGQPVFTKTVTVTEQRMVVLTVHKTEASPTKTSTTTSGLPPEGTGAVDSVEEMDLFDSIMLILAFCGIIPALMACICLVSVVCFILYQVYLALEAV